MKGLAETSPFHRFTNPRRDKSVYFWSRGSYLLFIFIRKSDQNWFSKTPRRVKQVKKKRNEFIIFL